jgi:hypothetical protein
MLHVFLHQPSQPGSVACLERCLDSLVLLHRLQPPLRGQVRLVAGTVEAAGDGLVLLGQRAVARRCQDRAVDRLVYLNPSFQMPRLSADPPR